jgi:hypothetical protein
MVLKNYLVKSPIKIYLNITETSKHPLIQNEEVMFKGKIEGKIEVAANWLKKGISLEEIIVLTGLS